jgi:hypothetical protein
MEEIMILNHGIEGSRRNLIYKIMRKTLLVGLLLIVLMTSVACNRSAKESINENKIEDSYNQSTASTTVVPTPAEESVTTTEPTPTNQPEPTLEPSPTQGPESTVKPTPAEDPAKVTEPVSTSDFVPAKDAIHSTTAFRHGNYLFYKSGKLTKTAITLRDTKKSTESEITVYEDSNYNNREFFLKGYHIYYHSEGDIYRVDVDGKNRVRLYKGTATILGFHEDDIIALDRKARELIRINNDGDKQSLTKLSSIDTLEAVMLPDGLYYISKSSNNTLNGNDPTDRLYYVDFDGKNKKEIDQALDIFDLKTNEAELFYLAVSDQPEVMRLQKVRNLAVTTLHQYNKEELEAMGCQWFEANTFTLLGANAEQVYYGIDFNSGTEMNVYSVSTKGENHQLYLNAFDIEGIYPAAYFRSGMLDGNYLKLVFDCDEAPVETYLIELSNNSSIKFEGGYYLSGSIDVEGEYVYYCKSSKLDRYGEIPEEYKYNRSKLVDLK